jgi:D-alanyl-D-alanine-carboxypeptidase/D-alanyl-D-alanine-endopeptidase
MFRIVAALAAFLMLAGGPAMADDATPAREPTPVIQGLDGDWAGSLNLGTGLVLRVVIHLRTDAKGTWGTMDSLDQGSFGVPVSSIARDGAKVVIEAKAIGGRLDAVLDGDGKAMRGLWLQGGVKMPLVLQHAASEAPPPAPAPRAPATDPWTTPTDAEILAVLKRRIDQEHRTVGIVAGVIDPSGRRVISYGSLEKGGARKVDGDTLFEIGSVTKVFTSLVLADMVRRGEVSLDDPVAKYLPAGTKVPERGGRQITLVDLATHTSGLPRLPTNMEPKDPTNPYADYDAARLYAFLGAYQLPRDIGSKFEYSNLGAGLLGHALSRRAGMDYETLVRTRVTGPLGMDSTVVTLTPKLKARLAAGYDPTLAPASNWDLGVLQGAGALRSSANDLLKLLAAELDYAPTSLKPDMEAMLATRRPTDAPKSEQVLGWQVLGFPQGEIVKHNGGTGGYRSYLAFDPKRRVGVVVLSNSESVMGVDDIGAYLMTGRPVAELPPPPPPPPSSGPHTAITVEPKVLAGYVGRYQLAPQVVITVTLEDGRLYAQLTGQGRYEVFPEAPAKVFWKVVDAQLDFVVGADGEATSAVLHQNGHDAPAPRLAD